MSVDMTVRYYLSQDNSLLGTEKFEGITELLIPLPEEDGPPITLTRFFENQVPHRWKIIKVEQPSPSEVNMHISARHECTDEVFLFKSYNDTRTIASRIQKGTFVEVEYGYVQTSRRHDGKIGSSKRYPDSVQRNEMYKRRLAIVVNSNFPILQIIPITSAEQDLGNNAIFEIPKESLNDLLDYNGVEKKSYALAHMIQSVSIRRVLPPKVWVKQGEKRRVLRSTQYPQKLNGQNLKLLESAITSAVGYGDYQSIRDERNHLRQANQQMKIYTAELETHNEELQSQVQQGLVLAKKYSVQMEILIDWTMNINSCSRADAIKSLEEEITMLMDV